MTAANITTARDEMLTVFKDAWDLSDTSNIYDVSYDDNDDFLATQSEKKAFARVKVQHATGGQSSLSNRSGVKNYTRTGFVAIQVFTRNGTGLSLSDLLSQIVMDAYEQTASTASGVWFRNVRLNEIGVDGIWYQVNVLADFTYEENK